MKISPTILALLVSTFFVYLSGSHADDEASCGCHVKDDTTVCIVKDMGDGASACACEKETMYGKRKFTKEVCDSVTEE
jgi:hypothetical protein